MAIEHNHEVAQRPLDQTSFRSVESQANNAFQHQVQQSSLADHRAAGAHKPADLGLPKLDLFDSTAQFGKATMPSDRGAAPSDKAQAPSERNAAAANNGSDGGPHIGNDLKGRIVKAIGANEGDLDHITKNDAGHGISVGIRQWNQKRGELPDLLKSFHDKNPEKFDQTFGPYAKNLQNEHWVRHANMAGNPDLMKRMQTALRDPEYQNVQIDKARGFAQKSIETAQRYGLNTEQGAALVADITNQMGEGGARRVLSRAGLHPGGTVQNEAETLKRIEHYTHRPNSHDRFNMIASSFSPSDRIQKRIIVDSMNNMA